MKNIGIRLEEDLIKELKKECEELGIYKYTNYIRFILNNREKIIKDLKKWLQRKLIKEQFLK